MPIIATLIYPGIQYPYIPGKLPPEDQVNAHPLTHQRTQQKTLGPTSLLRRAPYCHMAQSLWTLKTCLPAKADLRDLVLVVTNDSPPFRGGVQ
jgi:hypothetical protein